MRRAKKINLHIRISRIEQYILDSHEDQLREVIIDKLTSASIVLKYNLMNKWAQNNDGYGNGK